MDGGMDGAIKRYFSDVDNFIKNIQQQLLNICGGYQQTGTCILLNSRSTKCKYIAHCPTMHVPKYINDLNVIYNCYWNLLTTIYYHNNNNNNNDKIKNVLCIGLGTGVGNISYEVTLALFSLAISNFLDVLNNIELSNSKYYLIDWDYANDQYYKLNNLIGNLNTLKNDNDNDMFDIINIKQINLNTKLNKIELLKKKYNIDFNTLLHSNVSTNNGNEYYKDNVSNLIYIYNLFTFEWTKYTEDLFLELFPMITFCKKTNIIIDDNLLQNDLLNSNNDSTAISEYDLNDYQLNCLIDK
jgi:O-acetyl-ADP-ribose deacetylase (regulator of RNase III)